MNAGCETVSVPAPPAAAIVALGAGQVGEESWQEDFKQTCEHVLENRPPFKDARRRFAQLLAGHMGDSDLAGFAKKVSQSKLWFRDFFPDETAAEYTRNLAAERADLRELAGR